jgi:hypothetical protein
LTKALTRIFNNREKLAASEQREAELKKSYVRVSNDLDKLVREKVTGQGTDENVSIRQAFREGSVGAQSRQSARGATGNSFSGANEDPSNDTITLSDSFSSAQAHGSPLLDHALAQSISNNKYASTASLDFASCRQSHVEATGSPPGQTGLRGKPANRPHIPPFRVPPATRTSKNDEGKDSAGETRESLAQTGAQSVADSFSNWVRSLDTGYARIFFFLCV